MRRTTCLIAATLSAAFASHAPLAQQDRADTRAERLVRATPANAVQRSIDVGGGSRVYWLVAPLVDVPRPRAVLFVLHGGGAGRP